MVGERGAVDAIGRGTRTRLDAVVAFLVTVAVATGELAVPDESRAAFPGANGRIAFIGRQPGGVRNLFTVTPSGQGQQQLTSLPGFGANNPTWSPDGAQIAFDRCPHGACYLYLADAFDVLVEHDHEQAPTRRVPVDAGGLEPAFSPDGSRVAFSGAVQGDSRWQIYVANLDGSGLRKVTNAPASHHWPAWSPDGSKIAFTRQDPESLNIYVVNANGSGERQLTSDAGAEMSPDWSPDGTQIVFGFRHLPTETNVFVMNADGTGRRQLTPTDGVGDFDPVWSPDRRQIAYARSEAGGRRVYVMDSAGSGYRALTAPPLIAEAPSWQRPDVTPPAFQATGARRQRVRRTGPLVGFRCGEPCTIRLTARILIRGRSRPYGVLPVTRALALRLSGKQRLAFTPGVWRSVRLALLAGRTVTARVVLTARDRMGNSRVRRLTIRLAA